MAVAVVVVVVVVIELVIHHLVAQLEGRFPVLDFVGSFQQMMHVLVMLNGADVDVDGADLHHVVAAVAAMVLVVNSQLGDGDAHEMSQH